MPSSPNPSPLHRFPGMGQYERPLLYLWEIRLRNQTVLGVLRGLHGHMPICMLDMYV